MILFGDHLSLMGVGGTLLVAAGVMAVTNNPGAAQCPQRRAPWVCDHAAAHGMQVVAALAASPSLAAAFSGVQRPAAALAHGSCRCPALTGPEPTSSGSRPPASSRPASFKLPPPGRLRAPSYTAVAIVADFRADVVIRASSYKQLDTLPSRELHVRQPQLQPQPGAEV
jgi:hypothetical protein